MKDEQINRSTFTDSICSKWNEQENDEEIKEKTETKKNTKTPKC